MEENRNIDLEKLRASLLEVQTIYTTSLQYWIEDLVKVELYKEHGTTMEHGASKMHLNNTMHLRHRSQCETQQLW